MDPSHCCPWWLAYTFDNPLRRLVHDPQKVVGPYVRPGMTVLDFGCGMGYFSIAMAKMVGPEGRVLAVDLQPQMLAITMKRAKKAGVDGRVVPVPAEKTRFALPEPVDFALAMWVVHEVPGTERFLREVHAALKPGARLLIAEPKRHVKPAQLAEIIRAAHEAGFEVEARPAVRMSMAVVLRSNG